MVTKMIDKYDWLEWQTYENKLLLLEATTNVF